jgi:DNA-binding transcriptional ArsR family regulator
MTDSQTTEKYAIADELIIDNLDTLKVIADPLRKRIVSLFDKPKTVKSVAQELSTTPSKLYYHVNLLEEHGLLRVTDTRIVSGIIEKHYQIAAQSFRVKPGLLSPIQDDDENLNTLLTNMLDYTKEEIRASVRAGMIRFGDDAPLHKKLYLTFSDSLITEEQAIEFSQRLQALVHEFAGIDIEEGTPGAQQYVIQFAMFPSYNIPVTDEALDEHQD